MYNLRLDLGSGVRECHSHLVSSAGSHVRLLLKAGVLIGPGQVVLPDAKNRDKDVVAFLDKNLPAEPSEEDAGQLAAITALHKVAGDRSLHRVIPAQYQPLWQDLSKQVSLGFTSHFLIV